MSRSLCVAAVQAISRDGEVDANLARAGRLVSEAAQRGAQLVLCPEFLAAGYRYDVSIWKSGERRDGPTESWLRGLGARHGIYVGASYLEAEGEDFFNTFALAGPEGSIVGRVRKESLPIFEGWFFRSSPDPKFIDTELGRIGVGICNDNHTARFFERMIEAAPDLILMPHSAPCWTSLGGEYIRRGVAEIGPYYAERFGVPVVVVNKAKTRTVSPVPGLRGARVTLEFPGESAIIDREGRVRESIPEREGVIVTEVDIDPSAKRRPAMTNHGYWSRPPHSLVGPLGLLLVTLERLGKRAYGKSRSRRRAALAV